MIVVAEEKWWYTLADDSGRWTLTVLVGTSAQYFVTVALNSDEISRIRQDQAFVKVLANDIGNNPALFSSREVDRPRWEEAKDNDA